MKAVERQSFLHKKIKARSKAQDCVLLITQMQEIEHRT